MPSTEEDYLVWIERDSGTGIAVGETWSRPRKRNQPWPEFHRIGGPAVIRRDPSSGVAVKEEWYVDGQFDRADGPAVIHRDPVSGKIKYSSWYRNGQLIPRHKRPKTASKGPHPS
jgi:hypothetical protein